MPDYRLDIDPRDFLARYWQREHLFIPGGMPGFDPPADASELAGLALEEDVDSRIVSRVDEQWQQEQGPFSEEDLQREGAWTLLVQSVDHYWDDAAGLLGAVDWLPSWRLDDVMMSYATAQGSAGPHYDNYDVFIIQAEGERIWHIGDTCDEHTPLLPQRDLRLLRSFEARHEYHMRAGDVLYVPPGLAHYGVSVTESTSFSIGFRAPRMSDLLARWTDNRLETLDHGLLFRDPQRVAARRPGEITGEDLHRAREQLFALFDEADPRWLGEAVTADGGEDSAVEADPAELAGEALLVGRSPGCRIAWYALDSELLLFARGSSRRIPAALIGPVQDLCAGRSIAVMELQADKNGGRQLLAWLLDEGAVVIHD